MQKCIHFQTTVTLVTWSLVGDCTDNVCGVLNCSSLFNLHMKIVVLG